MAGMTLAEATAHLVATDPLFALGEAEIFGVRHPVFANTPQTLRELQQYGREVRQWDDYIVYQEERVTYETYCALSNKISHILTERLGVKPGDRVAIAMRNYPEYLPLFMGIVNVGAVAVLVNAWWTTEELTYGFEDSGAKLVFADGPRLERIAPFAAENDITMVGVRDAEAEVMLDDLISQTEETRWPTTPIDPDADFGLMYSSGSTGHPKGVVLTHRGAVSAIFSWIFGMKLPPLMAPADEQPPTPGLQCSMIATPLFHVTASHPLFLTSMGLGAKLVLMHKWDPAEALRLINAEKVTRFVGVPTMPAEMEAVARAEGIETPSLEALIAGGAKRPAAQVAPEAETFQGVSIGSGWGMTETNALGIGIAGPQYRERPNDIGVLMPPLQELKIVDDQRREVAPGVLGELMVKGPNLMRCYHNKPEATAEALQDGWFLTGDLGLIDADGCVTILDRKKNIIIRGGENISGLEVEAAIHRHADVIEAAAFAVEDKRLGEAVGVCVQTAPGAALTGAALNTFLADWLASFKHPAHIWWTDQTLPRGATDKTDRRAIKQLCEDGAFGAKDTTL
ncbi:MAG: class I adenylate-forming enzyme family protein [Pseudomonadota bacterium]